MSGESGIVLALRTVVALAVVLALLMVFLRWLDKNQKGMGRRRSTTAQAPVEVLSRTPLTRSSSVQVVRVGGQVLVLGVTDAAVSVLTDLGPSDFGHPGRSDGARRIGAGAPTNRGSEAVLQGDAADGIVATLLRRQGRHRDETAAVTGSSRTSMPPEGVP